MGTFCLLFMHQSGSLEDPTLLCRTVSYHYPEVEYARYATPGRWRRVAKWFDDLTLLQYSDGINTREDIGHFKKGSYNIVTALIPGKL